MGAVKKGYSVYSFKHALFLQVEEYEELQTSLEWLPLHCVVWNHFDAHAL